MAKVAVIILLSSEAVIGTEVEPFWAMVLLFIDTYFERFWWKFVNNSDMILCFSTRFTMQCLNFNWASLTTPNSNSTIFGSLKTNFACVKSEITMRQAFCCGKSSKQYHHCIKWPSKTLVLIHRVHPTLNVYCTFCLPVF